MKPPREPDAIGIGACLNSTSSSVHELLARAGQLAQLQRVIRDWAGEPLASSLTVANERDGTVIVYAASAAALTHLRHRQMELIRHLQPRMGSASTRIEAKINPAAKSG